MSRKAIIDLGTNTFHVLIADGLAIIHEEKQPVRMGLGGINQGIITEAGIERSLKCLHGFAEVCKQYSVSDIKAFGTSALRNASNGEAVANQIKLETGIPVTIISGDEEARYIYQGVRAAVPLGSEKNLLMDIGGGSVEFIIGNQTEIFWKKSIEVGGQRLLERFHKSDPISSSELESLVAHIHESLQPLREPLLNHNPKILVGSSGTFETLSDIYCERKGIVNEKLPNSPFELNYFESIRKDLTNSTLQERIAIPGMLDWRAEMIVSTCTLIACLLAMHSFNAIRVSRFSLKEGVLFG